MSKTHLASAISSAITCGLILSSSLTAQSFREALPSNTILYAGMPDIRQTLNEARTATPVAHMWAEEEVQDFLGEGVAQLKAMYQQYKAMGTEMHGAGQLPIDPTIVEQLRVNSAGFALTSLALRTFHDEPLPVVGFVLHMDFGDSAPQWKGLIGMGATMLAAQAGGEVEMTRPEFDGGQMICLTPTEEGFPMGLHMAFMGNEMVLGTMRADVEGIARRLKGGSGGGQTTTGGLQSVASMVDTNGAELVAVFQPGPLLDFAMSALRLAKAESGEAEFERMDVDGIERAVTALGLRSIKGVASVSRYENGRSVGDTVVAAPDGMRQGLFKAADTAISTDFLRWVPKDAVSMSAGGFDAVAVWNSIVGAVKAYDPELGDMALGMLGGLEEQVGMSISDDLLASLGNRYYSWSMPSMGLGTTPEMAMVLEVKNQEKLVRSLQTVAALTQGQLEFEEFDRRGVKGWQVRLEPDLSGLGAQAAMLSTMIDSMSPRFTFHNNHLVAAMTIGDVKRAIKRMDRGADAEMAEDIRSNGEFKPYLAQLSNLGETKVTSLSFTDWKTSFQTSYQGIVGFLPFLPIPPEVPVDLSLLPQADSLTQHLFGGFSWSTVDAGGFRSKSVTPFGPETIVPVVGLIVVGAGVAAFMGASDGAGPFQFR